MEETQIKNHYDNIDGLRAIAAIGVLIMHVMANGAFTLADSPVKTVIGSLGVFVQLFFLMSGFGLCCGFTSVSKTTVYHLTRSLISVI